MSELPDYIAEALIAYLREQNPALDEYQAGLDLARAANVAKYWERECLTTGRQKPTPFSILAREFVELSAQHAGATPSQTETGGSGARALVTLANGADLLDQETGASYTLQKARDTLKEARDGINRRAGLGPIRRYSTKADCEAENLARDGARVAILKTHIIGYEDLEGNRVSENDPDGWPIFKGYEPAPDRERISAEMRAIGAKLLSEG